MESFRLRQRLVANRAKKKYGLGLDHPLFTEKVEIHPRRKPDDLSDLLISKSDMKDGLSVVGSYFTKFTESDTQELLVASQTHWILTGDTFTDEVLTKLPDGIIQDLPLDDMNRNQVVFLWPIDPKLPVVELRVIHQIVRELIFGIFVLNQTPSLSLTANYDQSTTCLLPPAYQDTLIGQMMISVDFMMKCLWHGAYLPTERRIPFNETWKNRLGVTEDGVVETKLPVLYEFQAAGMYDITKEERFEHVYDKIPKQFLKPLEPPGDFLAEMENVIVTLTLFQHSIKHSSGIFALDADYFVAGGKRTADDEPTGYDHISEYIFSFGEVIKKNLTKKLHIKWQLELLKLVSLLVTVFITLKRRGLIPKLFKLLPAMSGESIATERTLPPITVGSDFVNSAFYQPERFFHLHGGIQFDVETTQPIDIPTELVKMVEQSLQNSENEDELSSIPTIEYNNVKYYVLKLSLEAYLVNEDPIWPRWINPLAAELAWVKFKRLPMISFQMYEVFKRFCGPKQAKKYKDLEWALHKAAAIGQVSIIHALIRLMPVTRLEKQTEEGLSVTHVATLYNQVHVLGQLAIAGMNMNVRKGLYSEPEDKTRWFLEMDENCRGFTPLHLAARIGAIHSLSFLLANGADVDARDKNGYAPIHHAAWSNQLHIVRLLVMKYGQLELETDDELKSIPLLLAAQRGALDTMVCLLEMGAERNRTDSTGRNCIVLAALEYRHHILDYFIEAQFQDMLAWTTLFNMLESEEALWRLGSVKTIEVLSGNPHHLQPILDAGIPQVMVKVLNEDDVDQQKGILISLSNISHNDYVRKAISSVDPIKVLVERLRSPTEIITILAAHVVFCICHIDENYIRFGEAGAMEALVNLLISESEELLMETTHALYSLCENSADNKQLVANFGGIAALVKLLARSNCSDRLTLSACAACTMLITGNVKNQGLMVQANGIVALSKLLHSNNVNIQTSGAKILGILATSHRKLINQDVMKPMIAMLKVWDVEVRINGASALWALAGNTLSVQKLTANSIGVKLLINMLITKNSQLIFYGCRFIAAFATEDVANQNSLVKEGGVEALVRYILACEDNEETVYEIIRTLGILCVGVAHTNNAAVQKQIAKQDSIRCMLKYMTAEKYSEDLRVEVIYTLACVILNNEENLNRLSHYGGFNYEIVIKLMHSEREYVRLKAGMALSTYAFNKQHFQNELHKAGKIEYTFFEYFLNSSIMNYKCQAAFQMAILSHLVENCNPIDITAKGLSFLAAKLTVVEDDDLIIIASLISSLARSTTGIPDGLVTLGVVDSLLNRLKSENVQARGTCAVALGYLSFNGKAFRQMLKACRAQPELFGHLMSSLQPSSKISEDFVTTFRASKQAGLPVVSLCSTRILGSKIGFKSPMKPFRM